MNMDSVGLLMSLIHLVNIIYEIESVSCFEEPCIFQGTIGCRKLKKNLTISQDDCCLGNGFGYFLNSDEVYRGCYKCEHCSEYIGRIDGGWSEWSQWTCSKTCVGGTRKRMRQCNNPIPSRLGKDCQGKAEDIETCYEHLCPVNGQWGEWRTWGACMAKDCKDLNKDGIQTRSRSCNNPKPKFEGEMCKGSIFEKRLCTGPFDNCPVNGGWSDWSPWICKDCMVVIRTRNCSNPFPKLGGKNCAGTSFQIKWKDDDLFKKHCFEECKPVKAEEGKEEPDSYVVESGSGNDKKIDKYADEDEEEVDDYGKE